MERKSLVAKPAWLEALEHRFGRAFGWHPNVLSGIKLVVVTPLLFLSFKQIDVLPHSNLIIIGLFLFFCLLDYLDGLVARAKNLASRFGRIFDRLTDYPLLILVAWQCIGIVPNWMLVTKLCLDLLLFIQFVVKQGTTENRIRTTLSYLTLIAMLMVSQGWVDRLVDAETVMALLVLNMIFSFIVVLFNARVLQKRFIADLLSLANLLCGVASMYFASVHRFEISLVLLMIGGVLDGFDGAAARKWGGTRFGVYSDDIADGVNYGIAPGVALYFAFPTAEGLLIGGVYILFTLTRLVYFTLNKNHADPNYFHGVPSTAGGLIVLCAIILWIDYPLALGLMVGIAMTLMVSFDALYQHLGRAFASRQKRYIIGVPVYGLMLILGSFLWGIDVSVALLLALILIYGFSPVFASIKTVLQSK